MPLVCDGLGTLLPNEERARELKYYADTRMLRSVRYLAKVVSRGTGKCVDSVLENVTGAEHIRLTNRRPVSSFVHIQHSRLKTGVETQSVEVAHSALDRLMKEAFLSDNLRYDILHGCAWSAEQSCYIQEVLNQSSLKTYGSEMGIRKPAGTVAASTLAAAKKMLLVLEHIDSELYKETLELVTDIVFFSSDTTISSSSFNSLGLVGMKCLHEEENWTTLLEMLVHESTHQYLFNVMANERILVTDSPAIHRSAFRRDLRPMSGIFHALIVVARLIFFMSKLSVYAIEQGVKIIPPPNNAKNTQPYVTKYADLLAVVEEHAELTKLGCELVESSKELAGMPILDEAFQ